MDRYKRFNMKEQGYESYTCFAPYAKVPRELKKYMSTHFSKNDKGVAMFRLACAVAYRSGYAHYANYTNFVPEGGWAGGIVGLKAILGDKKLKFDDAIALLTELQNKGYLTFSVKNKFIRYEMNDFDKQNNKIVYETEKVDYKTLKRNNKAVAVGAKILRQDDIYSQSGYTKRYNEWYFNNGKKEYERKAVDWKQPVINDANIERRAIWAKGDYGFIKFPKILLDERSARIQNHVGKRCNCNRSKAEASPFSEGEAFLDLYVHTVRRDFYNAFSWFCPTVMIENNAATSFNDLAKRWGWTKSKVQRFFAKHKKFFLCKKLNKNCGSLIFNVGISKKGDKLPTIKTIQRLVRKLIPIGKVCKNDFAEYIWYGSIGFIKKYFYNAVYCPNGNANSLFFKAFLKRNIEKRQNEDSSHIANTSVLMYDDRGFFVSECQRALIFNDWLCRYGYAEIRIA